MLRDLGQRLQQIERDTLIVFHQIGSHGPAYAERYPPSFEVFKPACHSHELHRCSEEEVRNAYDNTIAYTDHFLARSIESLRAAATSTACSLCLRPWRIARRTRHLSAWHALQFRAQGADVGAALLWASPSMRSRLALNGSCLQRQAHAPVSHDNLYHTLLSALGLHNQAYRVELDLLACCSSRPDRV